ncbi:MAG TPA: SAM hydroxide adenosyltransferase, partial [Pseudomonadales bacterium]|nr:SAM hydroxide adenosyltransferase [Pseudomonadales bacterium]
FALLASFALYGEEAAKQVEGTVTAVDPTYGNIDTDIGPERLVALGIKQGDSLVLAFNGKHFDVYVGAAYSDVPKGDWVAFVTSKTGKLRIARNLDNAARTLGISKGDSFSLSR